MAKKKKIKDPKLKDYFQGCLYFSLSTLQRSITRMAEEAFKPLELAPNQAFLLMALNEADYLTATELAQTLGLKPSTITRFVDKLEGRELCQREFAGKTAHISITRKGRKLMPKFQEAWESLFDNYNEVYGVKNAEILNNMITTLNKEVSDDY